MSEDTTKPRRAVVFDIPEGTRRALCQSCGAAIAFITNVKTGRAHPVEYAGERRGQSHFAFCNDPKRFRGTGRR